MPRWMQLTPDLYPKQTTACGLQSAVRLISIVRNSLQPAGKDRRISPHPRHIPNYQMHVYINTTLHSIHSQPLNKSKSIPSPLTQHIPHPGRPHHTLQLQRIPLREQNTHPTLRSLNNRRRIEPQKAHNLPIEDRILRNTIHNHPSHTTDLIPAEMMRALRIKQHGMSTRDKVTPRTRRFPRLGVLGNRAEGNIRRLRRCSEVISHTDEIEVRGDEDESSRATFVTAACDTFHQC